MHAYILSQVPTAEKTGGKDNEEKKGPGQGVRQDDHSHHNFI